MDEEVELSLRQFAAAWRALCSHAPRYRTLSAPDAEYVFSGVPIPFFNASISTGSDLTGTALWRQARAARDWAAESSVPWVFVVTDQCLAPGIDAVAALDEVGFVPVMPLTGMLAEHVAAPRPVEGLDLTRSREDADCRSVLDVNSLAYGMPLGEGKDVWGRQAFWKDHYLVLGKCGGEPASSSAVLIVDGYRYVNFVATAPDKQRRGYADAAMRHSLELARMDHGDLPTFLHATEAGRPVYERMSYRAVAYHTLFLDKVFLEAH